MASGRRKGVKRSDRRWIAPDGAEWDSKFEWRVFEGLKRTGRRVRRCTESDSIAYITPVKQGSCVECGGLKVVQNRIYTADLYVVDDPEDSAGGSYLVECKGFFPGPKRNLYRNLAKQLPGVSLRIIFEANRKLRGTKVTPVEYTHKYIKNVIPGVWDKKLEKVIWHEKGTA